MARRDSDRSTAPTLAGRVALVTGASVGIGEATAHLLTAEGARVALAGPHPDRLDGLAAQIRDAGGQVLPVSADLSTRTQARALVRHIVEAWDRLDILIVADGYDAAAGLPRDGAAARLRLGQPHPAVRGLLHLATATLPQMERQGGGDIVVIAPVASHVLRVGIGGLASGRVALEVAALCDNLRRRGGGRGIRVAVVEPDSLTPGPDADGIAPQGTRGGALAMPVRAEDVAEAILYVLTQPPHVSIAELLIRPTNRRA